MQTTISDTLKPIGGTVGRKKLIFTNTGANTVYFGFEPSTGAAGATQGVPLAPNTTGPTVILEGNEADMQQPLYFICSEGQSTTVNYTEK